MSKITNDGLALSATGCFIYNYTLMATVGVKGLNMFVFANICDFRKLFTVNHKLVCSVLFDEQLDHIKQNTNMFTLFNLLKSRH